MLFSHRTVKSVLLSSSRAREMNSVLIFVNVRCRSAKCHNRKCERISCLSLTWSHCLVRCSWSHLPYNTSSLRHRLHYSEAFNASVIHYAFTLYFFSKTLFLPPNNNNNNKKNDGRLKKPFICRVHTHTHTHTHSHTHTHTHTPTPTHLSLIHI